MTPAERRSLELRFHADMVEGIRTLSRVIGYRAPRFAQMVSEHGGAAAARILLGGGSRTSEGFQILLRHDQLHRSVEAWILRPEYDALFSSEDRAAARRRLEDHGYDVDRYLRSLGDSE